MAHCSPSEALHHAAGLCAVSAATFESREVPELDALYCWEPLRGGLSLLVSLIDGPALVAFSSALPFEEHAAAFAAGRRPDSVYVESLRQFRTS